MKKFLALILSSILSISCLFTTAMAEAPEKIQPKPICKHEETVPFVDTRCHGEKCKSCGEVITKEAHLYDYEIIQESTADEDGLEHLCCIKCGYEKDRIYRGLRWKRLAGANRYNTMAEILEYGCEDDSCECIVIATGSAFPDALAGASLAGLLEAPLLITKKDKLPDATKEEIERIAKPGCKVYILGGTGAVSDSVKEAILAIEKVDAVERVAGANREKTALEVLKAGGDKWSDTLILTTGYNFADALSIGPYAYASKTPILLTRKSGELALDILLEVGEMNQFSNVILVGGNSCVSEETEGLLKKMGKQVIRLAGPTRYETSVEIAKWSLGLSDAAFQPEVLLQPNGIGVATGSNFADALSAVSLLGKMQAPLLLVSNAASKLQMNVDNAEALLGPWISPWGDDNLNIGFIFGGSDVVSREIKMALPKTYRFQQTIDLQ